MNDNYICGGDKFTYSKGYIGLPIALNDLPESIEVNGISLQKKDEFHVSLLCVKNILKNLPDAEEEILKSFCDYVKEKDISFVRFTGKFHFAEKEERKTVVALCEIENLKEFLDQLSSELGIKIPYQPTHVTLYTLQTNAGIGLNSEEELASLTKEVEVPDKLKTSVDTL